MKTSEFNTFFHSYQNEYHQRIQTLENIMYELLNSLSKSKDLLDGRVKSSQISFSNKNKFTWNLNELRSININDSRYMISLGKIPTSNFSLNDIPYFGGISVYKHTGQKTYISDLIKVQDIVANWDGIYFTDINKEILQNHNIGFNEFSLGKKIQESTPKQLSLAILEKYSA